MAWVLGFDYMKGLNLRIVQCFSKVVSYGPAMHSNQELAVLNAC